MRSGGLSWRFVGGLVLIVALALGASFWLFAAELEQLRDEELTSQLLAEARLLGLVMQENWAARDAGPIAGMVHALHDEGTDVVVIAADDRLLANTFAAGATPGGLLERPEVKEALVNGQGAGTGAGIHGPGLTRAVAVRVGSDADELGVVWLARPRWTFVTHASSFRGVMLLVAAAAVAIVLGLSLAMTRRWTRLLRKLARAARSLSEGDLSARADIEGADEFARLAGSLDHMRGRLLAHADTIERQRATLAALLDQLREGVIACGPDGRIILINSAAVRLLRLETGPGSGGLIGHAVEAVVPQHELQNLLRCQPAAPTDVRRAAPGGQPGPPAPPPEERPLVLDAGGSPVRVLARGSNLQLPDPREPGQPVTGRMLVLTDITAFEQASRMQTDFVANASHELRTPLSSIRAAIETLLQMDLPHEAAEARQFMEVIDRHSARLAALAGDLLDLARIQSPTAPLKPATIDLAAWLSDLGARFARAAQAKGVDCHVDGPTGERRSLLASDHLLRLVLDNLVDNAIAFTAPGGHVRVACRAEPEGTVFEVTDDGCGIPESEQQRVFERFYQVAQARSGQNRGTGLGLSIVRDAVTALKGQVRLESRVGVGTRVVVSVPQPPARAGLAANLPGGTLQESVKPA